MTIRYEDAPFGVLGEGNVLLYKQIDDRNSTNTTRWRVVGIRCINGSTLPYNVWVRDPNIEGSQVNFRFEAGEDRTELIPPQFQTQDVEAYSFGGEAIFE